jgi:Leucine-rich repeat (LRR) protein
MSMNDIKHLQPFPTTDAKIFFICRHCRISEIAPHAFVDSPNILSLDLAFNELKSDALIPEIFRGPENDEKYAPIKLKTLRLCHNKINYLDRKIFEHTQDLKILDLSYNDIKSFDEGTEHAIGSLHKLEVHKLLNLRL